MLRRTSEISLKVSHICSINDDVQLPLGTAALEVTLKDAPMTAAFFKTIFTNPSLRTLAPAYQVRERNELDRDIDRQMQFRPIFPYPPWNSDVSPSTFPLTTVLIGRKE